MRTGFYQKFLKRFFDVFISLSALILLCKIFIVIYILSAIILRGNPIFKQYRPGKKGKIFLLYKFRSMTNKKDAQGNLLPDKDRITGWGKFLRKTSLDELPQLFNILKGDMSIVGPRPRIVQECVFLDASNQKRFNVRPGITGLAQVNGRNNITFDKVVKLDNKYVDNLSLWLDIKIIFKTIGYVFSSKGVNKNGTVSNEFYGDYLLRIGEIDKLYYNSKIEEAEQLIIQYKEARRR